MPDADRDEKVVEWNRYAAMRSSSLVILVARTPFDESQAGCYAMFWRWPADDKSSFVHHANTGRPPENALT